MIKIENLNISFDRIIFEDVNLVLNSGKLNILIGESGSGKTTLLSYLGLISKISNFTYQFDDQILNDKTSLEYYRKYMIGYVFQENYLFEKLTVKENILFSAHISGLNFNENELWQLMQITHTDHLKDIYPSQLSGGEKQRVAIAFAMAKNPRLLLLDEPTSFLDKKNAVYIFQILRDISQLGNTIILISTHDHHLAQYADNIFEIKDHKILKSKNSDSGLSCQLYQK